MTQKELLYLEDAIGHESVIVDVLEESINNLEDEELISFLQEQCKNHQSFKEKLMKKLEDCANA